MRKIIVSGGAFLIGLGLSLNVMAVRQDAPPPAPPSPSPQAQPAAPAHHSAPRHKTPPEPKHEHHRVAAKTHEKRVSHHVISANWCEEKGGEKNALGICEIPYSQDECDSEGGVLDEQGSCHFKVADCGSLGAVQNEQGNCIELPKKRHHTKSKPECGDNEALNQDNECVATISPQEGCENQGGYFSEQSGCLFKKDCEDNGGKWDEQQNSCTQ